MVSYLILIGHLYLSGGWLGVELQKQIGLCAQILLIILGSIVNVKGGVVDLYGLLMARCLLDNS